MELTASCYRVCENAGTLAVQVMRSGNSVDPAYIGIQVKFISSKLIDTSSKKEVIEFNVIYSPLFFAGGRRNG